MNRRRFFPATRTQLVPGRTVELELQLRPEAKAPAATAAATSQVWGATWLPHQTNWADEESSVSTDLGGGRWDISNGWGIPMSIWEGVPAALDTSGQALPLVGAGFRCIELVVETSYWVEGRDMEFFGTIVGPTMVDVRWEFEWDHPHSETPGFSERLNYAESFANVIRVALALTGGDRNSEETLTARAFSGGAQVAELKIVAIGRAA